MLLTHHDLSDILSAYGTMSLFRVVGPSETTTTVTIGAVAITTITTTTAGIEAQRRVDILAYEMEEMMEKVLRALDARSKEPKP